MKYARVVLGIPPEGPFDYIVPQACRNPGVGSRVIVPFASRTLLGFVVGISEKSKFKKLKEIKQVLDEYPVLSRRYLNLCRELAGYYCSSWGQMIETGIPRFFKQNRPLPEIPGLKNVAARRSRPAFELVFDLGRRKRYGEYFKAASRSIKRGESVLIIVPDKSVLSDIQREINPALGLEPVIIKKDESFKAGIEKLRMLSSLSPKVVIGMRSAVFAQVANLGLIILDEEESPVYKQEQVPCYHARRVALFRAKSEGIDLILGTQAPSLESYESGIKIKALDKDTSVCSVSIINMQSEFLRGRYKKREPMVSSELENLISDSLATSQKIILFSNRSGFAHTIKCPSCGFRFTCQRCNLPLVFHLDKNILLCRRCNYKAAVENICPKCNSGYMHYFSFGIEKLEKELNRVFPQASIARFDKETSLPEGNYDILIVSQVALKTNLASCGLLGVVSIDNLLNQVDFRASEKAFGLLFKLKRMCKGKMVIQTMSPGHYCFDAIKKNDYLSFYKKEFAARKELKLPPCRHFIIVNLRGKSEDSVAKAAEGLRVLLKSRFSSLKHTGIVALAKNVPFKLRGNFRWQVVLRSSRPKAASLKLKQVLRNFRASGIIVTVDVDPV